MEIKIPQVGESVYEAQLVKWHQADGATVAKDELLCELETDKVALELHAEASGTLNIAVKEGETVKVGTVVGTIAESAESATTAAPAPSPAAVAASAPASPAPHPAATAPEPVPSPPPAAAPPPATAAAPSPTDTAARKSERKAMSPIRKRIAERLLAARQQTAMLTTFNEADLSRVQELRAKYRESFQKHHNVKLGLMSFFVKASIAALRAYPEVNARIDGGDLVFQHFYDIGVAIGAERGLVVPVLRDADRLHFADIEAAIADFGARADANRLTLEELEGGTFTISNGGIYGSLLSTPILNPPQSAVLGLHAIQQRPVVRDEQIVIRPMMYLALSYDHRIIDGRQAVGFLKLIKEYIEEPEEMLLEL